MKKTTGWLKISDGDPKEDGAYWIYTPKLKLLNYVTMAEWKNGIGSFYFPERYRHEITHYMKINKPEPPTE